LDFAKFDKQLEHEEERNEKMDLKTFKNKVISLSWVNAFKSMISTRCYPWDNPELDESRPRVASARGHPRRRACRCSARPALRHHRPV
jgi:uncharacterized protein (DUF1919 family)